MQHPDLQFGQQLGDKNNGRRGGINPNSEVDVVRLRESMDFSAREMQPFIERYVEAVRYFAGNRFGGNSGLDKTPVNMVRLAVDIWVRQLISQNPRVLVLARTPGVQTSAYELELATNFLLGKMKFAETMAEAVRSAVFLIGVVKVGLTNRYLSDDIGFRSEAGNPYAETVFIEDFLFDMNARRRDEIDWIGNRYRIPYDLVMQNPDFDPEVKRQLAPESDSDEQHAGSQQRTEFLTSERAITKTEYRRRIELWDIWIPGDNLFVTLPAQQGLKPLQVREWEGPETGPYHMLSFSAVPGNILPAAPIQTLYDLQDLMTTLFNHVSRQAIRQKTVTVADGQAEADGTAQRIMDARDGDVIKTGHIDGVKEMKYGGVDPGVLNFVIWLKETMSYMGGNLDAMGGLSQQGNTLGQEQLLIQSSSQMLQDMQANVVTFATAIIRDLAWYMYTDPVSTFALSKQIEGFGELPFEYGPDSRQSEFFHHTFELHPHSLNSKGPQQRLGSIMQIAQQVLMPLAPQMAEWGMQLNVKKLVDLIAKYSDLPEIAELVSSDEPMSAEQTPSPEHTTPGRRPLQSPSTTRNYVRENRSTGGTQQARDNELRTALASAANKE